MWAFYSASSSFFYWLPVFISAGPLLIVLEYLPYGDLLGYLRISRGHSDSYNTGEKKPSSRLAVKDLLSFAWMIADGMMYLADMKVRFNYSKFGQPLIGLPFPFPLPPSPPPSLTLPPPPPLPTPYIKAHILLTFLRTRLMELVREICLNIKTSYPW